MNKTMIIGNLTRDPEIREVPGSTGQTVKVCTFDVAVNMRYGGNENTVYYRVSAWRQLGEICQQYLNKGRKVYVDGIVSARVYQSSTGEWKASLNISADTVEFLTSRTDGQQSAPAAQQSAPAPRQTRNAAAQPQPTYGVEPADPNNGFIPVECDDLPF